MKKVPRAFEISWQGQTVTRLGGFNEGCEWVGAGEGIATVKYDGTACLVRDGRLFARYDAKHGKTPPADFEPAQEKADEVTGHWPGWVPVLDVTTTPKAQYKWHAAAFASYKDPLPNGTYELCGPHFQTNPHKYETDTFLRHGFHVVDAPDRTEEGLRALVEATGSEGIVFHHPDGRMAKVCADEFGIRWKK